jgi:hypothetical protein
VTLFRDPLLVRLAAEWERAELCEVVADEQWRRWQDDDSPQNVRVARQARDDARQARERAASAYCERFRELWEERFGCE